MNFPYSKKAFLALSLATAVVATSNGAWAASDSDKANASNQTTVQVQTAPASKTLVEATQPTTPDVTKPSPAASTSLEQELTIDKAVKQALETNSSLRSFRIDLISSDLNARLVNAKVKDVSADFIDNIDAATAKYVNTAKADSTKKVNQLSLRTVENNVKLGAQKAYYDLLNAQNDLELKKQSLKRAETQLKVAQSAFKVGTRAKTDVLQAEAGLARAQAQLALSESNVEVYRMQLNQFIGVDINTKWTLKTDDHEMKAEQASLDKAIETALKQRPEIVQREEEIKIAEINVEIIRKYLSIATYRGEMALNTIQQSKLALEDEKRAINVEVAQAYYNLEATKTSIAAYLKAKEAATENYRLTNLRFENGLATALEVITAEEDLSTQENQFLQALHNYNLAAIKFDNALGN